MRTMFTTLAIGLTAALMNGPHAASQEAAQWEDLFGQDLKDWSRSGSGKSPWRITTDRTLYCSGATELYIPERDFADGTLKFEFRFRLTDKKTGYQAAVWARRTIGGTGYKISLGDDCGKLSAIFEAGSDRQKTFEQKPETSPAKKIGEWNEVELILKDRRVQVRVNGKEITGFGNCDTDRGLFALEAEGSEVEFRSVKWKEAK